jgi:hypothetical protein
MARFFGSVVGSRGPTHRLGGSTSGIHTCAAGWSGSVKVDLFDHEGDDWCHVYTDTWHGVGTFQTLYRGPVDVSKADERVRWNLKNRSSNAKAKGKRT